MRRKQAPRIMGRLASAGLALVLLLLASVSLWSSYATQVVADRVALASRDSALFRDIRKDFDSARTAQLAYGTVTRPNPTLHARFESASAAARTSLGTALGVAEGDDRSTAHRLLTLLGQYEAASRQFFIAVNSGHRIQAARLERSVLAPLLRRMDVLESTVQSRQSAQVFTAALSAAGSVGAIRTGVALGIALGLALLACFGALLRIYQRRVEVEERKHRTLVEQLPVAAYMGPVDAQGPMTYVGREIESILGYSRTEWLENRELWATLLHPEDRARVLDERRRHLDQGGRFLSEYRMKALDGHTVWVRDEAVIVHDGPRGAATLHGVVSDITERKLTAQILEHQVLHDALTSLPNRTLLFDRLQQAIRAAHRNASPVALLLMDLDRFKEVNDTFGHQCGDLLLQEVSRRFRSTLRDSDTIARLGGDEFAVLLIGADALGAATAADKLSLALKAPVDIDDHSLDIGISIGAALYPDGGADATVLLQRAEVAMYSAKRAESRFAFYESEQDPYSPTRLALIRDLRQAIERDDLTLHYQPKANFETGCAAHVEALARWHHQDHGFVPPDHFIPLAEHAGLINALSMWVLNAALRQCRQWHEDGLDVSVAVNLSPRSLHDPNLVQAISDALRRWGASPGWLQLEITEGALMVDPARAMDTLSRLHSMGICIAIDDFGTGYSSLGYLKRLPADQIKIDKSFVQDMASNEDDAFIVRSVIDLGHSLGLEVVAEGVEDQTTWDMLAAMGCDLGQGYHLSRPLPSAQLGQWLKQPVTFLAPGGTRALNSVRAAGA